MRGKGKGKRSKSLSFFEMKKGEGKGEEIPSFFLERKGKGKRSGKGKVFIQGYSVFMCTNDPGVSLDGKDGGMKSVKAEMSSQTEDCERAEGPVRRNGAGFF